LGAVAKLKHWFRSRECSKLASTQVERSSVAKVEATLDPLDPKQAAVLFLMDWLTPSEIGKIKELFRVYGHQEWLWHWNDEWMDELYPEERKCAVLLGPRFGLGMQVRNALRRAGFGGGEIGELNQIYVGLLEKAALEYDEVHPDRLDCSSFVDSCSSSHC
jgi:hypothetical protein